MVVDRSVVEDAVPDVVDGEASSTLKGTRKAAKGGDDG